jgi:hypothetical protein
MSICLKLFDITFNCFRLLRDALRDTRTRRS